MRACRGDLGLAAACVLDALAGTGSNAPDDPNAPDIPDALAARALAGGILIATALHELTLIRRLLSAPE